MSVSKGNVVTQQKPTFVVFDEDNHEIYGPFEDEKSAKAAAYDLGESNNSVCKVVRLLEVRS